MRQRRSPIPLLVPAAAVAAYQLWYPSGGAEGLEYVGRDQIVFTTEREMHGGQAVAWRVPAFPPKHPGRASGETTRGVRLPGAATNSEARSRAA